MTLALPITFSAFPDAAAAFQQAIRLEPNYAQTQQWLGSTYVEMGKKEDALQVYRKLQTMDKAKAQELFAEINKGTSSQPTTNSGNPATGPASGAGRPSRPTRGAPPVEAEPGTSRGRSQPNGPAGMTAAAYYEQGDKSLRAGEPATAIEAFKKAIALKPTMAEAYRRLGDAYSVDDQYQLATSAYKQCAVLKPDLEDCFQRLGHIYHRSNQYTDGLAAFRGAARANPDSEEAQYWVGRMYVELKQFENAVAPLQAALRSRPDGRNAPGDINSKSWYAGGVLGFAYMNLKQYPNAVTALQRAVRLLPETKGDIYVYDFQAETLDGFSVAYTNYMLGVAHAETGDKNNAMLVQRRLQTLDQKLAQRLLDRIKQSR